jgi:hypothetical protein
MVELCTKVFKNSKKVFAVGLRNFAKRKLFRGERQSSIELLLVLAKGDSSPLEGWHLERG